jgi:two-component system nitrate/nitrite response regulator NarL
MCTQPTSCMMIPNHTSFEIWEPVGTTMIKNPISTLIAAKPDRLRDGLHLLLSTVPQVSIIQQADDLAMTFQLVAEQCPDLVVLDTNLDVTGVDHLLKRIKQKLPALPCLVVVADDEQQRIAWDAGADAVLLKGFSSTELLALVERLVDSSSPVEVTA